MLELTRFVTCYAEAWCSRNPESVTAFFAEDGSLNVSSRPPALGRAVIAEIARGFVCLAVSALIVLLSSPASAKPKQAHQHAGHNLGTVSFSVSCSKEAQAEFNRAVALLHHMTYPQAREAFQHVATIDPKCAMAHWGVAMTLFQPLWPTRPSPKALQQGWDEVQKAKELDPPTERERLFVAAAAGVLSRSGFSGLLAQDSSMGTSDGKGLQSVPGRSRGSCILRFGAFGHGSIG